MKEKGKGRTVTFLLSALILANKTAMDEGPALDSMNLLFILISRLTNDGSKYTAALCPVTSFPPVINWSQNGLLRICDLVAMT